MKIISKKNECYVQGNDLDYLMNNETLNNECRSEIDKLLYSNNLNDYIKIDNESLKYEILQNENILSFAKHYNMKLEKLCSLEFKLMIDIINLEDEKHDKQYTEENKNINRLNHIRYQINEMIKYKLKQSKCNFPNIDNPCIESIISGNYNACLSLDYDKVLVHSVDNNKIDESEVNSFCDVAYKLIMRDKLVSEHKEEVELEINKENDETLSISEKLKKEKQLKKKKKDLLKA